MKPNLTALDDERAVSPVIGIILMVAITVILAAVIGTFVLSLGSNVEQNPQVGVSFLKTADDTVQVTLTSVRRADAVTVDWGGGATSALGTTVGNVVENSNLDPGDKIIVTASYEGKTVTIATFTV